MVCNRCIMAVQAVLSKEGIHYTHVQLGEVDVPNLPDHDALKKLDSSLKDLGFELLADQRKQQIEKIKNLLIHKVQSGNIEEHFSISSHVSSSLLKEYANISKLFSSVEGVSIEQYFILQKIEKVKEWLTYGDLTLSEIAWRLGYSSVAHLSGQFKKVTGLSPSNFTKHKLQRKPLDKVKS